MKRLSLLLILFICIIFTGCVSFDGTSGEPVYKQIHATDNYGFGYVETCTTSVFITEKNIVVRMYFKRDNSNNEYFSFIYPKTSNPKSYALDLGEFWSYIGDSETPQKYRTYCYKIWRKDHNASFRNTMYGTEYKCTMKQSQLIKYKNVVELT